MRVFQKPNLSNNWKCPICNTNEEKEVVLIAIDGTVSGGNVEAAQYHLNCIELTEYDYGDPYGVVLAMKFDRRNVHDYIMRRNTPWTMYDLHKSLK